MNASSWRKAADLVAQRTSANLQVQAAAMAESKQLQSLPLSALSADDSGLLQVTYGSQQPLATSTPRATSTSTPETPTETYRQVIPGVSNCLYPTLVADGLLSTHVADNHGTLQNQITSEVDKYLQEAAEKHERDVNYFDGWHMATNTSSQQQKANFVGHDEEKVPESNGQDTGKNGAKNAEHDIQYCNELETILEEEEDEDPQMAEKQDVDDSDTIAYTPEESEEEPFNVKNLQQVVDDYYDKCPTEVMSRLEHQITDIMNAMYDSVTNDNFDSISDYIDRVSGVVDNDYDRNDNDQMPYDNDNDQMPYDNDNDQMSYDNDNDQMPYVYDDNDTAIT